MISMVTKHEETNETFGLLTSRAAPVWPVPLSGQVKWEKVQGRSDGYQNSRNLAAN